MELATGRLLFLPPVPFLSNSAFLLFKLPFSHLCSQGVEFCWSSTLLPPPQSWLSVNYKLPVALCPLLFSCFPLPCLPRLVRARYYWNQLYYHQYLHLNDDGTLQPSDWSGQADENYNQFNVDFVYTWQFAPGSFLNLIWKNAVLEGDQTRGDNFGHNWSKTFQSPQNNMLTLKLIYWLDAGSWGRG